VESVGIHIWPWPIARDDGFSLKEGCLQLCQRIRSRGVILDLLLVELDCVVAAGVDFLIPADRSVAGRSGAENTFHFYPWDR